MYDNPNINPYQPIEARNMVQPSQKYYNKDKILLKIGASIILTGVILFFVGAIIFQSIWLMNIEDYDSYQDFNNDLKGKAGFGRILSWIGALLIVFPLYLIGVISDSLDWKVRASMLSTATAIVIATLIVTMFITFPSMQYYYY